MQMIGLQATELYLQTEEAYFSAVIFLFLLFHPRLVVLFSYLGPLFFLKMLLLHSTGSDEIKMHYSFVDSCVVYTVWWNLTYVYLIHTYRQPQLKQDCSPSTHFCPRILHAEVCLGRGMFSYL